VDQLLKKINSTGVTERPKRRGRPRSYAATTGISENIELVEELICSKKVLCTSTKIRTKLEERWTFHGRLFGVLQSMIFG